MVVYHDNYKCSPGWQLCARMTIFDYYAPKWWKFGQFVFRHFFLAMAAVGAGTVMMSAASPSCCNVYLLHLHHPTPPSHCPVTALLTSSEVLHLRIPKVSSFGGCAGVVGIFNGVEDWPGRIRARQKKVGNKLRRGKLVAVVADDDGAADSNGASSGDGEDVAPTAPDCESIVSLLSLCVCISVCVCPFPFLQTLNPNSGHF
jgi:hypothetical protein